MTLNNYDNTLSCFATVTSGLTASNGTPINIISLDDIQRDELQHFRLVDQDISNHFDDIMKAIATTFPKLRGLRLGNASITHISKDNLKSFPELELLSLGNNKIDVLDSDLFVNTPKMKFIYFDNNLISNVDDNLLSSLDYVEVEFASNPCIKEGTCKSQLHYEKLKDKNPKLYNYYALYQSVQAVLEENPNYGSLALKPKNQR